MHIFFYLFWGLFIIINLFLALHFLIPVFLFIIHWFLPKSSEKILQRYDRVSDKQYDFGAIITAHKDARFISPIVDSLLKQNHDPFLIYVVADDCFIDNLLFTDDRVVMLRPPKPLNAKIKSIQYATDNFIRKHDCLIILDSDNLVHPEYLQKLNCYFQRGFKTVQANMLSKNLDTKFAKVDALGRSYHNFIEGQVKMELGITSSLFGSGVAVNMDIYNKIIYKNILGGFDKTLQIQIVSLGEIIAFANDAIIYEEKVGDATSFEKQRTRWIFTYFKYFKESFSFFVNQLIQRHIGGTLLAFTMLRPPMFITIGLSLIAMASSFFIYPLLGWLWLAVFGLYTINFISIAGTQSQQPGVIYGLLYLPNMIVRQIKSLLKIKQARKRFLKTKHRKAIYVDDLPDVI